MRLSVALCTYNGAQYLPEQLDSIARQTRPPDELVVIDDVSSDATLAILHDFAARVPFAVCIEQNPHNIGSTRNFERAIRACSGDLIALCDQDDVWLPHKLARLEAALRAHPDASLAFSDAALVDQQLQPLGRTMFQHVRLGPRQQTRLQSSDAFVMLLKRYYITGATLLFRAAWRDAVLPISPHWVHDAWISINLAAQSSFVIVPEPLIQYRQHAANQIGATSHRRHILRRMWHLMRTQPASYAREYQAYLDVYTHLSQRLPSGAAPDALAALRDKVDHWAIRAAIDAPPLTRLRQIGGELARGRYQRYSIRGVWSAARDALYLAYSLLDRAAAPGDSPN